MGRPPTRPKPLRDGYYLDIRNKGSNSGVKIFRETLEEMEDAAQTYRKSKDVIVLGESKNGEWVKDKKPKIAKDKSALKPKKAAEPKAKSAPKEKSKPAPKAKAEPKAKAKPKAAPKPKEKPKAKAKKK